MIDHVLLEVPNLKKFTAFFKAALKPLGIKVLHSGEEFVVGNDDGMPFHLYVGKKRVLTRNADIAFSAQNRKQVDDFHRQAPGMIDRRSGGILNVAFTIAFQPAPYQAVYGASKAFVLS